MNGGVRCELAMAGNQGCVQDPRMVMRLLCLVGLTCWGAMGQTFNEGESIFLSVPRLLGQRWNATRNRNRNRIQASPEPLNDRHRV